MKKITGIIAASSLLLAMCSSTLSGAYTFPKEFFDLQQGLDVAVAAGDNRGIIEFATKQYDLFSSAPRDNDINEVTATKTYTIAQAYEKLGEYENAAVWYERAIESNEALGFADAVKISREKARQFKTETSLYKKTYDTQINFGAKNEPEMGVLTGIAFDSPTRSVLSNESMILIYHMHGNDFNLYYENFLKEASEKKKAVEIAYNVNGASDIGMINMSTRQIEEFAMILQKYPDVPIYLRFAGEINNWDVKPSAEDYKKAFRSVAGIMRSYAPNVAMVYGLNFVSTWDTNFEDFYPGDEYVDWVGVSLYCRKYFKGYSTTEFNDKLDEIMFFGGDSAEPVLIMDEIVKTFGNRKPIMVFESGATGHTVSNGEYSEDWANRRIAKILNYLPMKYPQIKMIGYFDQYVASENDDYSLKNHSSMKEFYNSQVGKTQFIQDRYDNDNVSASINCDNGFTVSQTVNTMSVYAQIYGSQYEKVDYFVDDVWVAAASAIPYSADIDFSQFPVGTHVFRYNVTDSNGRIYSKSVNFTVTENIKISIDGNMLTGLDQPPVMVNNRTLVPVRALYEALGAEISWNPDTETVTATKDGETIQMTIGSKEIYKNGSFHCTTDVSPKIINNRTLIPARLAAELYSRTVGWEQTTQTVTIN